MAAGALVPQSPAADYHVGILRPTGPGPAGQSTGVSRGLAFGQNRSQSNGHNRYLNANYVPRIFAPPYDQCQFHAGALVFSNNASYTPNGGGHGPRDQELAENRTLRDDSCIPLHVLNMISRDAARNARSLVAQYRAGASMRAALMNPLNIFEVPEKALAPQLQHLVLNGVADEFSMVPLSWTATGAALLYNFLGAVVIQNNEAPPALGGQDNPVLSLNVGNAGAVPYPVKDIWGAEAQEMAYLYLIVKLVPVPGAPGLVQVAWLPYATVDKSVPARRLAFQGHNGYEEGYHILVGQVRDRLTDPVGKEIIARAIGMDPSASPRECDAAFGLLPDLMVDLCENRRVTI